MKNSVKVLLLLLLSGSEVFAQTGTIRGFVYEKNSGEPVIFTNVFLKGTTIGSATDVNGFYQIMKVPVGTYQLAVTGLGYDTIYKDITVKANEITSDKLYMEKAAVKLSTASISAEKEEAKTEVKISINKITPREMKMVPSVGGEPDFAQTLQIQPGVIFTGDQGGQLYIRGGSPVQNKVLLDGMVVYNPFHSIGLFSVFDTDIIRNADVYTGGFTAEYGGRISSIMDITTKNGNTNRISGKISASPFGANAILEGPIVKPKEEGGGGLSFILSGKTSYLEQSSKVFYPYINNDTLGNSNGLPFNYTDLYGKISATGGNGSKFNLFGFNFSDNVKYQALSNLKWNQYGVGSNFILVPGSSTTLIQGNFAYSNYKIALTEEDQKPRESSINGFNLGLAFVYYTGKNELKYGLEVLGFKTDFTFYNAANRKIEQEENTTEFAAYVKYRVNLKRLVLEPSFRFQYYASLSTPSFEPRLGAKYNITDWLRIKYAGGFYSQNLLSANSDRDVVNLFYGFLSGPDNLPKEFQGEEVTHKLQKSIHNIAGFEVDLTKRISLNIEGYIKHFTQLTNINRDKLFDDNAANTDVPDVLKKDYIIEKGKAMGIDFLLKYDYKRFYFWGVYSLAKNTRTDELRTYSPVFDRRHNVNIVAAYKLGKSLSWELSARWNLGSGFPFTKTQGYYPNLNFSGGITTDYTTANSTDNASLGIVYGDINTGRLSYYHRFDISVKKTFTFTKNTTLELNLSVTNVYNRENVFYFDRIKYQRVNQLPILPSLGIAFRF
ncbi:MAG: hypothetical protein POELPBGB_00069 [Bacteroidia bacterium]|nr:hypothetical protein [Bacteroidia bacterium]